MDYSDKLEGQPKDVDFEEDYLDENDEEDFGQGAVGRVLDDENQSHVSSDSEPVFDQEEAFEEEEVDQSQGGRQRQFKQPRRQLQQHTAVADLVKQFITYFDRYIKEKNVYEIHSMYESGFNKLTEKYFKDSTWPSADLIAPLVNHDQVFLILYKELYYRHIYSKMVPNIEQRIDSWKNYCDFFNLLLKSNVDLDLDLPKQWIWDMIDEFIYQFQSFYQYRSKLKNKKQEELVALKNNPQIWSVSLVINYLQSLVAKSNIIQFLQRQKQGVEESAPQPDFHTHPVYRYVGYFSLIGLLRIHCLLGDYELALKTIAPIDLYIKGLFTQVTACHITLYYYVGFVYVMLRRYPDAIKAFSHILLYISRMKQFHTRSYQFDQVQKKTEKMYGLLAICISLCPQRVEESVHTILREKYSDKMLKMQKGDEATFEELFTLACPKFINPATPNYALILEDSSKASANLATDALKAQTRIFLAEVKQQILIPTIRSYLKLYTTISLQKLASFLEVDEKDLKKTLACYKHKTRNLVWNGGAPLNGEWSSSSDVDFYIETDMVHIYDAKVQRRYSEFFIRNINKFEEIIVDVESDKKSPAHKSQAVTAK